MALGIGIFCFAYVAYKTLAFIREWCKDENDPNEGGIKL